MPRKRKTRGRRANDNGSLYQRKQDNKWIYAITFKSKRPFFKNPKQNTITDEITDER